MEVKVDSPVIDPFSDLIRNIRERTEEFLFFLKHFITAPFALLESLVVELIELVRDALPEFFEGIIHVIPAPGDDGGGDFANRAFYRRFLTRGFLTRAGRIARA